MSRLSVFLRSLLRAAGHFVRETNHSSLMYWARVGGFSAANGELQSILSAWEDESRRASETRHGKPPVGVS